MNLCGIARRYFATILEIWLRISDENHYGIVSKPLKTVCLLVILFVGTLVFDILSNYASSDYSDMTILEHIQMSFEFSTFICLIFIGCVVLVILVLSVMDAPIYSIIIIYVLLFKLFELLPPICDFINLIFIYQKKILFAIRQKHSQEEPSAFLTSNIQIFYLEYWSFRLILSLICVLGRFFCIIRLARRVENDKHKRLLIICDLILFILSTTTLLRYSNKNSMRILRKIFLVWLRFHLRSFVGNEPFWNDLTNYAAKISWKNGIFSKFFMTIISFVYKQVAYGVQLPDPKAVRTILVFHLAVILFLFYQCIGVHRSLILSLYYDHTVTKSICLLISQHLSVFSGMLFFLVGWDTFKSWRELDQHGVVWFCTGVGALSKWKSSDNLTAHLPQSPASIQHVPPVQHDDSEDQYSDEFQ
jgi:hypothetical protein